MDNLHPGERQPEKGDVWTGFEWVRPLRYDQLRATTMPDLPPMQLSPGDDRGEDVTHEDLAAMLADARQNSPPFVDKTPTGQIVMPPHYELLRDKKFRDGLAALINVDASQIEARMLAAGYIEPTEEQMAEMRRSAEFLLYQTDAPMETFGDDNEEEEAPLSSLHLQQCGRAKRAPLVQRIARAIHELLVLVDPDPSRGGLAETPARAARAWLDWTAGYAVDPAALLKCFEDGAQGCDEMVVVHDIPIYSHCEHHLAPIFGTATIGYLPDKKIVGLSKLNRLADVFARRLQVQERMTNQIAEALMKHLKPLGCGVVIKARHLCMESRGVKQAGTFTTTSALRGAFREDPTVRAEFLALTRGEK